MFNTIRECSGVNLAGGPAALGTPKPGRKPRPLGTSPLYPREARVVNVQTPQGPKTAGAIVSEDGRQIFLKRVLQCKHLQKCYNAWGIDRQALTQIHRQGVGRVRIEALDTGAIEEAPVEAYAAHGILKDFGFGPQVFLPRKFFRRIDKTQGELFAEV